MSCVASFCQICRQYMTTRMVHNWLLSILPRREDVISNEFHRAVDDFVNAMSRRSREMYLILGLSYMIAQTRTLTDAV